MIRVPLTVLGLLTLSSSAYAQSFVTDTITTTPGFGSVIDSGPGRFSSSVIDGRMTMLHDQATADGCVAVEWAGTWVRGRSPRLQGLTDAGGTVMGASITNGTVDGVGFSSSLETNGQLVGATEEGNELIGYFARINSNRSIWYGVEVECMPEPLPSLLAYYDFDGSVEDKVANAPTLSLLNGAALTSGNGGSSGDVGDEALDLGADNNGAVATTATGSHFDEITTNNAVAISWWQNANTVTAPTSSFGFDAATGITHSLQVHATWSDSVFYFDHSGCCSAATRTTVSPGAIVPNTWQHIVVQKDASGMREIWIDGSLAAFQAGGTNLPSYTGAVGIGAFSPGGTRSFGGVIDDYAVFSEPLTSAQIAVLAGGGTPLDL